jgi:hypothetical protein
MPDILSGTYPVQWVVLRWSGPSLQEVLISTEADRPAHSSRNPAGTIHYGVPGYSLHHSGRCNQPAVLAALIDAVLIAN